MKVADNENSRKIIEIIEKHLGVTVELEYNMDCDSLEFTVRDLLFYRGTCQWHIMLNENKSEEIALGEIEIAIIHAMFTELKDSFLGWTTASQVAEDDFTGEDELILY